MVYEIIPIESWLFNDGILISWFMKLSLYKWVVFHPLYTLNNQGELVTAHVGFLLGMFP